MNSKDFDNLLYDNPTELNLYEMSDLTPDITGLPDNIIIWARVDSSDHGHNRYKVKATKNREFSAIFLVSKKPVIKKESNIPKNRLSSKEKQIVSAFIIKYSSLIISWIDGKLTSNQVNTEILKIRGTE